MELVEIYDEMQVLHDQAKTIRNRAKEDNRDLTEEEAADLNDCLDKWDAFNGEAETLKRIHAQEETLAASTGRMTKSSEPEETQTVRSPRLRTPIEVKPVAARATDRGTYGFDSIGHWATACQQAWVNPQQADPRLTARMAASTYGSEGVGADGGFAVPPDFKAEIVKLMEDEEGLLGRTDQITTSSNSVTVPVDESEPWTSSGIYAEWEGESDTYSEKKPALKQRTVRANKLVCMVKVTEELLDDAAAMDSYLRSTVPGRISFEITDKLINGTGAGQPLGIINSGATVVTDKVSGQTADTSNYLNIMSMWNKCYGPSRSNAVWVANQDTEVQLLDLAFDYGASNQTRPIYMPGMNMSGTPFATLLGRPIIFSQACKQLGDKGDIILADWSKYMSVVKGGLRSEVSIHLHFDQDVTSYKFVVRVGGNPWWSSTLSAKNGSGTYSPYVVLEARE